MKHFVLFCALVLFAGTTYSQVTDGFQYPLNDGYVESCNFGELGTCFYPDQYHLADDFGQVSVGDPVFSTARGLVKDASSHGGYGGTVLIEHELPSGEFVVSLYAHMNALTLQVTENQFVERGVLIGYIARTGTTPDGNGGNYNPHLHFGIHKGSFAATPTLTCDGEWSYHGYTDDPCDLSNWYNPSDFVDANQPNDPLAKVGLQQDKARNAAIVTCYNLLKGQGIDLGLPWSWGVDANGAPMPDIVHVRGNWIMQTFYKENSGRVHDHSIIVYNQTMDQAFAIHSGFWGYSVERSFWNLAQPPTNNETGSPTLATQYFGPGSLQGYARLIWNGNQPVGSQFTYYDQYGNVVVDDDVTFTVSTSSAPLVNPSYGSARLDQKVIASTKEQAPNTQPMGPESTYEVYNNQYLVGYTGQSVKLNHGSYQDKFTIKVNGNHVPVNPFTVTGDINVQVQVSSGGGGPAVVAITNWTLTPSSLYTNKLGRVQATLDEIAGGSITYDEVKLTIYQPGGSVLNIGRAFNLHWDPYSYGGWMAIWDIVFPTAGTYTAKVEGRIGSSWTTLSGQGQTNPFAFTVGQTNGEVGEARVVNWDVTPSQPTINQRGDVRVYLQEVTATAVDYDEIKMSIVRSDGTVQRTASWNNYHIVPGGQYWFQVGNIFFPIADTYTAKIEARIGSSWQILTSNGVGNPLPFSVGPTNGIIGRGVVVDWDFTPDSSGLEAPTTVAIRANLEEIDGYSVDYDAMAIFVRNSSGATIDSFSYDPSLYMPLAKNRWIQLGSVDINTVGSYTVQVNGKIGTTWSTLYDLGYAPNPQTFNVGGNPAQLDTVPAVVVLHKFLPEQPYIYDEWLVNRVDLMNPSQGIAVYDSFTVEIHGQDSIFQRLSYSGGTLEQDSVRMLPSIFGPVTYPGKYQFYVFGFRHGQQTLLETTADSIDNPLVFSVAADTTTAMVTTLQYWPTVLTDADEYFTPNAVLSNVSTSDIAVYDSVHVEVDSSGTVIRRKQFYDITVYPGQNYEMEMFMQPLQSAGDYTLQVVGWVNGSDSLITANDSTDNPLPLTVLIHPRNLSILSADWTFETDPFQNYNIDWWGNNPGVFNDWSAPQGSYYARLQTTTAGNYWDAGIYEQVSITQGEEYTLQLNARTDGPNRTLYLMVTGDASTGWTNRGLYEEASLNGQWQSLTYTFTANVTDPQAIFYLEFGDTTGMIHVDDVILYAPTDTTTPTLVNVLPGGDFEYESSFFEEGWDYYGGTGMISEDFATPQGDLVARFTVGTAGSNIWDAAVYYAGVPVEQTDYTLKLWLKTNASGGSQDVVVTLNDYQGNWPPLGLYETLTVSSQWQEFTVAFTCTTADDSARFSIETGDVASTVYIDDVRLLVPSGLEKGSGSPEARVIPTRYALHQNYPNPFNPTTTIRYDVPEFVPVRIDVFNILGQRVTTLVNERKAAGSYTAVWNVHTIASGMYIYRMQAGKFAEIKKMIVLK